MEYSTGFSQRTRGMAVCEGLGREELIIPFALRYRRVSYLTSKSTPPGVARQQVTFFCFAKIKVTKEKATPVCRPCGVPCVARLVRLPHKLARSASRPRAQTYSSEFPDQPALLGGAQGRKSGNPKPKNRVGNKLPTTLK